MPTTNIYIIQYIYIYIYMYVCCVCVVCVCLWCVLCVCVCVCALVYIYTHGCVLYACLSKSLLFQHSLHKLHSTCCSTHISFVCGICQLCCREQCQDICTFIVWFVVGLAGIVGDADQKCHLKGLRVAGGLVGGREHEVLHSIPQSLSVL